MSYQEIIDKAEKVRQKNLHEKQQLKHKMDLYAKLFYVLCAFVYLFMGEEDETKKTKIKNLIKALCYILAELGTGAKPEF